MAALGQAWGENPERGVYKTEDGGKTWSRVLYVDARTGAADLVIDPRNPNKLFAAMWQYRRWPWFFKSGGPGSGLYVTYDGGRDLEALHRGGRHAEGGSRADRPRRLALATPTWSMPRSRPPKSALLRSDDGGRSWQTVNDRYDANPRPFYFAHIEVDPELPNRLYSLDFNLRVSNDGGKSFEDLIPGFLIHGDYHAIWIDPRDPSRFYVGNDGGVAFTRDRGKTMQFVANLPLAQFYHVAVDDQVPYNVYGGLQDNGAWRGPSTVWQQRRDPQP